MILGAAVIDDVLGLVVLAAVSGLIASADAGLPLTVGPVVWLALKAVLANGEIITTSRRARKSAAGYDLTRLLVGSEGTLGVITEVALKLYGIPESIVSAVCPFPSVEACCKATITAIQRSGARRELTVLTLGNKCTNNS